MPDATTGLIDGREQSDDIHAFDLIAAATAPTSRRGPR